MCPIIQIFWKLVHNTILSGTEENVEFSPALYLLHHIAIPKRQYLKPLAMFMINAARHCIPCHWHCIPCHWHSTAPPTREECYCRLNNIEKKLKNSSVSCMKRLPNSHQHSTVGNTIKKKPAYLVNVC